MVAAERTWVAAETGLLGPAGMVAAAATGMVAAAATGMAAAAGQDTG